MKLPRALLAPGRLTGRFRTTVATGRPRMSFDIEVAARFSVTDEFEGLRKWSPFIGGGRKVRSKEDPFTDAPPNKPKRSLSRPPVTGEQP